MFQDTSKQKFLFQCEECLMIISVEFEEKSDLQEVQDNKMILSCPCGGHSKVLRD
jgi:hypothetical protein